MPTVGVGTVPTGRWFDAARVPSSDGARAISLLQDDSGPVIEDQAASTLTWLVRVDSLNGSDLAGVEVLSAGRVVAVPPATWTGTMFRWLIPPPAEGDCLTSSESLHTALATVLGERRRWDGEARRA
jgi:hypothetical protein